MLLVVDSLFYTLPAAKKGMLLPLEPVAGTLYLGITLETLGAFHLSHGWQLQLCYWIIFGLVSAMK